MTTKSQTDNTEWLDEILDRIDFKLKPVEIRGVKFADEIVITGKKRAKQAIQAKLKEQDIKSRIDQTLILKRKLSAYPETFETTNSELFRLNQLRSKL